VVNWLVGMLAFRLDLRKIRSLLDRVLFSAESAAPSGEP
jgi:hypothetical protein